MSPAIFTFTGNLLAERTQHFAAWAPGRTQRATGESFQVGGKGINVAKMLARFGTPVTALAFAGCGGSRHDATYARLRSDIDSIKVISTHSHNRVFPEFQGHDYNFYSILFWSYMINDIASAGGPAWGAARFEDAQGGVWRKLSVRDLLGDNDFMNIGV